MTIGEKMTITTWRARQLAYLEEMYSPGEHMGKLMSHLGARHVYIQLYEQMHAALESLPEQPNSYVAMAVYRKLREDMSTLDDMLDQLEDTGLHDPDEYDPPSATSFRSASRTSCACTSPACPRAALT